MLCCGLCCLLQNSVWGSGAAGAFCAAAALATGEFDLWQIGFVASFTSKLSDTVSSEIGKVRLPNFEGVLRYVEAYATEHCCIADCKAECCVQKSGVLSLCTFSVPRRILPHHRAAAATGAPAYHSSIARDTRTPATLKIADT